MFKIRLLPLSWMILSLVQTLNGQWVNMNSPWDISSFASSGRSLFAGRFSGSGGVLLSTDYGLNWNEINSGIPTPSYVYSFALKGDSVYVGTFNNGVFLTTNNGSSWAAHNQGLTNARVFSLAASGSNLFAGTDGGGVFRSINGGMDWVQVNIGLTDTIVLSLVADGSNIFAGTQLQGVFRSSDNGTSWIAANNGLPTSPVLALTVKDNNLFAGTSSEGAFLSTNHGSSWASISPVAGLSEVIGFAISDTALFVGVRGRGVYLTTNNGTSWSDFNTGLGFYAMNAILTTDAYLYLGTDMGVWRRPISDMITSVKDKSNQIPLHIALDQNYPNPFNPETTISFSLPSQTFVSLKIFDVLGKELSILISEKLSAGTYSKTWNASGLPSGIYFYRLQAGDFVESKKLVLQK